MWTLLDTFERFSIISDEDDNNSNNYDDNLEIGKSNDYDVPEITKKDNCIDDNNETNKHKKKEMRKIEKNVFSVLFFCFLSISFISLKVDPSRGVQGDTGGPRRDSGDPSGKRGTQGSPGGPLWGALGPSWSSQYTLETPCWDLLLRK